MRQRFFSVMLLAALVGCSKSDSNPIIDFGEGEGITYRTATNLPVGPRDYTDWTSDAEWNKQERALFSDLNFDLNGSQRTALIGETTVYPNPAPGNLANWELQLRQTGNNAPPLCITQAVMVNRKYEVLIRIPAFTSNYGINYRFDYASLGLSPNELYRIYYVVYDTSGLIYKGHGDIRYSPQ